MTPGAAGEFDQVVAVSTIAEADGINGDSNTLRFGNCGSALYLAEFAIFCTIAQQYHHPA